MVCRPLKEGEIDEGGKVDEKDVRNYICVAYLERLMIEQEGVSLEEFPDWGFFVQVWKQQGESSGSVLLFETWIVSQVRLESTNKSAQGRRGSHGCCQEHLVVLVQP